MYAAHRMEPARFRGLKGRQVFSYGASALAHDEFHRCPGGKVLPGVRAPQPVLVPRGLSQPGGLLLALERFT